MSVRADINPRRLDQLITFQRKSETRDSASGELIPDPWVNVCSCLAAIDAVRAKERFLASQELPAGEYTVWIYWRNDIDTNMRILWGSRIFDISGIPDNQKRGLFLSLFCIEGVNRG
jgi:SPP1 family predicted phage head-tail adaptor